MSPEISIRPATLHDISEILRQRRRMYEDMRYTDAAPLDEMAKLTKQYLTQSLTKTFHAWIACLQNSNEKPIAGGAVLITPWPAHPYDLVCRRATILNVYTDPEFRRQGIARTLMHTMIAWCKQQGLARVTLHASDDGRHLYESLGFETSNEMKLKLR
ncbi:MAG TPA: GNAT family N-acetyltransferase [Candidatus Solibacter sp.]|nr:GNAT family N-acetyltransferase [Candidatus Solibacter sp.]